MLGSFEYALNYLLDNQIDNCIKTVPIASTTSTALLSFKAKPTPSKPSYTDLMKQRIYSETDRAACGQRFASVEPMFGNIQHNKQLNRFTLRGQKKVDTHWKLSSI